MLFRHITAVRADGTPLEDVYVGIRGTTITHVGPERPAGDWGEEIDGRRYLLMPGFVNSHTHVAMNLMRGYGDDMPLDRWLNERIFPFEDKLTGEDVYWGSLLGIAEMLACGVTSFSDMYFFCDDIVRAVLESGIKANIGRGISAFDPAKRFAELPACAETTALLHERQGAGDGRVLIDVAPHSEYTTRPDILADAAALAADNGARIQVHVAETRKEQLECTGRHGMTPTRVLEAAGVFAVPVTLAHGVWLTDSDMDILAAHDVTVAHCPKSNLKLASGIARVARLREKGIPVAIGTDSAASNNALDMFEEMRLASLLAKGVSLEPTALPAAEALYMATRAGALAQGRADCGDIVPGYRADLVLLDGDSTRLIPAHSAVSNIVYAAGSGSVAMTIVDGRVLYRDGAYTTLDVERIGAEAARCVARILSR